MSNFEIALNWQEKLKIMNKIAPCALVMRKPGDWYVSQDTSLKEKKGALVSVYGNGIEPADAVENHWQKLTRLKEGEYVWSGYLHRRFVWDEVLWAEVIISRELDETIKAA